LAAGVESAGAFDDCVPPENTHSTRGLHLVAEYDHVKFAFRGHMQRTRRSSTPAAFVLSGTQRKGDWQEGTKTLLIDRRRATL
jgi:hypothetical protein